MVTSCPNSAPITPSNTTAVVCFRFSSATLDGFLTTFISANVCKVIKPKFSPKLTLRGCSYLRPVPLPRPPPLRAIRTEELDYQKLVDFDSAIATTRWALECCTLVNTATNCLPAFSFLLDPFSPIRPGVELEQLRESKIHHVSFCVYHLCIFFFFFFPYTSVPTDEPRDIDVAICEPSFQLEVV